MRNGRWASFVGLAVDDARVPLYRRSKLRLQQTDFLPGVIYVAHRSILGISDVLAK